MTVSVYWRKVRRGVMYHYPGRCSKGMETENRSKAAWQLAMPKDRVQGGQVEGWKF